ncbi:group II intron reverse transcriptase [Geminocystis sp.]|uniref:group II intron reverse transcriptase n=1 Tax=Geminocystis sp. TaxID=2664100 RepID=UPI00359401D4
MRVLGSEGWFSSMEGTPQGGVISPLLANIALHGMENRIKEFARTLKGGKERNEQALGLIRYADDFVILHRELEVIKICKLIMEEWLGEIGLELNLEKTSITHTLYCHEGNVGFDFLGFNVRQYAVEDRFSGKKRNGEKLGFKTLIKPSKKNIKEHSRKLKEIVHDHNTAPQEALISRLNPVIKGWCNYYKVVCSSETFDKLDHEMYLKLEKWAFRRHLGKSKKVAVRKYWHTVGGDNWVFSTENGLNLFKHTWTKIVRHTKVKGSKSPFDGDVAYWAKRMGENPLLSNRESFLLKRDKGVCKVCVAQFMTGDLWEIDHIIPKSLGGRDSYDNLQLLHKHCHDKKTASDGSLTRS